MKNIGVIFDLDGTLWNSSEVVVKSWNEVIGTYCDIDYKMTVETIQGFMGKTIQEIARLFFIGMPFEKAMEITNRCCLQEQKNLAVNGGVLYPILKETLEKLSTDYKLYIVSNCQTPYLEAFLEYHKLGNYFVDYEVAGRTGLTKGENIRMLVDRNHLEKAVYIGDTEGDYAAAKAAGIPFIHAKYGFGRIEEEVPCITSFSELPEKVRDILE